MAMIAGPLVVGNNDADTVATLATLTASAAILIGEHRLFAINATGDVHIRVGASGVGAPTATTDFRVPANQVLTYDMGKATHIRIFNPTGGNVTYFIQRLGK